MTRTARFRGATDLGVASILEQPLPPWTKSTMETIANIWTAIIVVTLLALVITYFWIVVQAFREHLLWGVTTVIVPVVYVVFAALNWERSRRPFMIGLWAWMALFVELLVTKLFQVTLA